MLTKIMLALAVLLAVVATIPAPASRPGGAQTALSYNDNPTKLASGGGNLVPLW